jgi:putative transposase
MTKYRRKVITPEIIERLKAILVSVCTKWKCELLEFNGETDHLHLLVAAHPDMNLSVFVNNLKTVSSRMIRKEFKNHIDIFYKIPVFWKKAYCAISVGGAPLAILKQYIQSQGDKD